MYNDAVASACGRTSSAVGPFYCPVDQEVYIDLSFYRELQGRFGAPGDFAEAYVIAHEVGHHLQRLRGDLAPEGSSSVALELQADCLAGAWAKHAEKRGLLETGDVGEALGAASAIGDDRIQQETTGRVRPDQFTHGSSKQRAEAFRRGYDGGEIASCSR
jgi:predicted metalloprotease